MGWHFLQIPGPTNIPGRVLRAISRPTIDHRSKEFSRLSLGAIEGLKDIFDTAAHIVIYPSSGTGACEAALANTLSPGDRVVAYETGFFASLWSQTAQRLGLVVDLLPGDWRHGVDAGAIEQVLSADRGRDIKAVLVVHNETSTGVTSSIPAVREALDRAHHPALLLVDTVSSLASIDYRHDEWRVDVTISASQKGLMLPPGLGFNIIGEKAVQASKSAKLRRSYWEWEPFLEANRSGFFPYTPATNLFFGLNESLAMLRAEGLENVLSRHDRHAAATRAAVKGWGLEVVCSNPDEYSSSLTAVLLPEGHDADNVREVIYIGSNMSLGSGLGRQAGQVFRIGHLGAFNDAMLAGTLASVQMGLVAAGVPINNAGLSDAIQCLTDGGSIPAHQGS